MTGAGDTMAKCMKCGSTKNLIWNQYLILCHTCDTKKSVHGNFNKAKKQHWNHFDYEKWFNTPKGRLIDKLERNHIKKALRKIPTKDLHVFDYGIGNGRITDLYLKKATHIHGVDISKKQLLDMPQKIRKHVSPEVISGESYLSKLDPELYDLTVASRVLQHINRQEKAFEHLVRITKRGGYILLVTYNRNSYYGLLKRIENKYVNPLKGRFIEPQQLISWGHTYNVSLAYSGSSMIIPPELYPDKLHMIEKYEEHMHEAINKPYGCRLIYLFRKKKNGGRQ